MYLHGSSKSNGSALARAMLPDDITGPAGLSNMWGFELNYPVTSISYRRVSLRTKHVILGAPVVLRIPSYLQILSKYVHSSHKSK